LPIIDKAGDGALLDCYAKSLFFGETPTPTLLT